MDSIGNGQRYSRIAMAFHWIIAILIALNFAAALVAEGMPKAEAAQVMANHKAIGVTVLVLTIARIIWRLMHAPPPLLDSLHVWEKTLARIVHTLFYVAMLLLPLSGWAMHSAFSGGKPVSIFGLFDFPGLPFRANKALAGVFDDIHVSLAALMFALIVLHVTGALKHLLIDRDGTMRRMLPGR